jgi:hypothetical protein
MNEMRNRKLHIMAKDELKLNNIIKWCNKLISSGEVYQAQLTYYLNAYRPNDSGES